MVLRHLQMEALWQYVQLADGSYGYVNSKLVSSEAGANAPAAMAAASDAAMAATDAANAAKSASLAATTVAAPTIPPPPQPAPVSAPQQTAAVDEAGRRQQIITSSNFYHDQSPDSGEIPGRSMVLRVDATYANAQQGDEIRGGLVQNGQAVGSCLSH